MFSHWALANLCFSMLLRLVGERYMIGLWADANLVRILTWGFSWTTFIARFEDWGLRGLLIVSNNFLALVLWVKVTPHHVCRVCDAAWCVGETI
jgi:hypothetical protein